MELTLIGLYTVGYGAGWVVCMKLPLTGLFTVGIGTGWV
jgi:hypothetical protein